MIKNIKIYGERNSGTNFIQQLLENNLINVNIYSGIFNKGTGWKHGAPKLKHFKNLNNTLFIFVIRDLEKWLKSMYYNQYNLQQIYGIERFLTSRLKSGDDRRKHDMNTNIFETRGNIFYLRYYKIRTYLSFFEKIQNGIIINLEDIQKDSGRKFINSLNKNFGCKLNKNFIEVKRHTKNNKLALKNRKHDITLNKNIIEKHKNIKYEKFVFQLKKNYKIKSNVKL